MGDERYLSAFLSLLLLAGCTDVFDNAESWDYFDEHATSGAEDDVETTGDGSTSASTTDASGETTGASPSLPGEYGGFAPEILSLSVSPDMVEGAGSALVFLEHTANAGQLSVVAEAELRGEVQSITLFDGDAASVSWPVEFAITSAEAFNGAWTVRARVENGYGVDEAAVDLAVELPPGGQEVWSRVVEAQSGFHFATAIAAHPAGAAVAVRIDKIGEVLGIVRLHAGETGEIAWESEPLGEFDPAGIAALGDGQIVVAGTDLGLARARTFTFAPEEGTAPVDTWTAGTGHNEARALAHAEDGSLVIAGVEHKEAHDDVIVWSFPAAADPSILRWDGQDPVETRDEAANAVFVDGERILVAGTAEIQDGNNAVRPRMFVLEYQSSALTRWWGHLVGDEFLALQSEARGVSGDGHGGAVVVGTARPTPVSPAFTQVLRLDPETLEAEPQPFNDEIEGVAVGAALDPTGRVVVALENGSHAPATIDVAALHPAAASVGWQAGWEPPAGAALARGLAVDRHGFVFWIGDAYDNGVHVLVGKRHP